MIPAAHRTLADQRAGAASVQPTDDETGEPLRVLPIFGLAAFVAFTVVLARVSSRLADITGVVLFAAAVAWLLWPVCARLSRHIGVVGALVVIIAGSLVAGLGLGALLLGDLTTGARIVSDRLNESLAGDGDVSTLDQIQRAARLGDGISEWLTSLPNSVLFGTAGGPAVGHRVADFLVVVVLAAFLLASGPSVVAAIVAWWPRPERARVWALLNDIDQRAGGYLRRLALVGFGSGALIAGGAAAAGAAMPVALGLWAGFWLAVPVIGWGIGLVPVVVACLYMRPVPAAVLATSGLVAALGVHLLRRHDHHSRRIRPGTGAVVLCLAIGVAISGSATAVLVLIAGVVLYAALTSEHRAVRWPGQVASGWSTYRLGPLTIPRGWRGVVFAAGAVLVAVITWTVAARAAEALVWIVIAALLAIAIDRPTKFISRNLRLPRLGALAMTVTLIAAGVAALIVSALSEGPTSAARALQRLPSVIADLEDIPVIGRFLEDRRVADTISDNLEQLPSRLSRSSGAIAWFPSVGSQMVDVAWVLVLTIALAVDGRRIVDGLINRVGVRHRRQVIRMTSVTHTALAGYAAGAVLVSAMNATVVMVLALVLNLGLAPVLALWAFLWDFIPQVGGIIGGLPLLMMSLLAGPSAFLITTAVYLVYQIIESNLIFPRIIGESVDIPPWATMVAALAGAAAGGVVGAIVLTPLVGVVRKAVLEYRRGDFPGRTVAATADDAGGSALSGPC